MTGSLQSRKGKYYSVLNLRGEDGERKQRSINLHIDDIPGNKRKAVKAHREVLAEYERKNITVASGNIQFCDFLKIWIDDIQHRLQPNTFEYYSKVIEKHLHPYFKELSISLADLEYRHLKQYYNHKGESLSVNTLKKHHTMIKQTLRKAVQDGLILSNPADNVRFGKMKRFEGNFLTIEQGNILLEAAKGKSIEPCIILAMMYGLRRSEIAGLKWSAIDFGSNIISINHVRTRYSTEIAKDETKNKTSNRILPLNNTVKNYLRQLQKRQIEEKLLLGSVYENTEYVCRWANGRAMKCEYFSKAFKRLLTESGLPDIRLHDLRHTCASYMLKKGCTMKEVSDWLGHSDIGTTMNIYAHVDWDAKKDVAARIDSVFSIIV